MTSHPECDRCGFHKHAANVGIAGNGDANPDVLVVIGRPNSADDERNTVCHPYVKYNVQLHEICDAISAETGTTFRFTSALRCYSGVVGATGMAKQKPVTPKEITACRPWLQEEIAAVKPRVVLLMGSTAMKTALGNAGPLQKVRGAVLERDGQAYIPTWDPSNMMYRASSDGYSQISPSQYKEMITEDLITCCKYLAGAHEPDAKIDWYVVGDKAEAMEVLWSLQKAESFAVDIETNTYQGTPVETVFHAGLELTCIGFSWEDHKGVVVPLMALPEQPTHAKFQPDEFWQRQFLHAVFECPGLMVGQNLAYDLLGMHMRYDTPMWHDYDDIMLLHHLLWSHLPHSLREMARMYTKFGGYEEEVTSLVAQIKTKELKGYHRIPFEPLARKNGYDAALTFLLNKKLKPMVYADPQLRWVYENITIPSTRSLMKMSKHGLYFDAENVREALVSNRIMLHRLHEVLRRHPSWEKAEEILSEAGKLKGGHLDVKRGLDRIVVLFERRCEALTPSKVSKNTGDPSTDKEVLQDLADGGSDMAYGIRMMRQLQTAEEKLLKPFPGWVGFDGYVHTEYKVHGTRTGRISSARPNGLNIPSHMLYLLRARTGRILLVGDISQAEVRINAFVCMVAFLLEAYSSGIGPDGEPLDIHALIGSEMLGLDYVELKHNNDLRRTIKACVFGMSYGMTEHGLARKTRKTVEECRAIIDAFYARFPEIRIELFEHSKIQLLQDGYIRTKFGRYWHLSEGQKAMFEKLKNYQKKYDPGFDIWEHAGAMRALRQAANCKIQSVASDIVMCGMIKLEKALEQDLGLSHGVDMANEVYDSVVLEVREDLLMPAAVLLRDCLEHPDLPIELPIPWKADIKWGYTMEKEKMQEVIFE